MTHTLKLPKLRYGFAAFFATFILVLFALIVIFPLVLPFMFVFKTQLEYSYDPWGWPKSLYTKNFIEAWAAVQIGQGLMNTLYVCIGAIVCTIPAAALAGYVFARYRTRATEFFFYAVLIGYFVPVQMVLIPLYKFNIKIGLANTLPGLFLPMGAFGIPFWTLIYRSFFQSLPNDLAEAARIDGAGHGGTFFRIMLPLAAPATFLAFLLVFISAWSDYFLSLIMLNDQKLFTIQLRVSQFLNAYGTGRMPRYAAAAIISAAPTILLYAVGHRWIIRGTLAGALKE
ncbi:MAG TPA: carbohydrate ABC transporter permease [Treponemataceae bacterium]|jgi:ABC-type glycerol-3-phosphate transport system permease component|nr:carbohydrate ABC transporter permease [Treponemataceae bacterium]